MRKTRKIANAKNGKERDREIVKAEKERLNNRIDKNLLCPMNALQIVLD